MHKVVFFTPNSACFIISTNHSHMAVKYWDGQNVMPRKIFQTPKLDFRAILWKKELKVANLSEERKCFESNLKNWVRKKWENLWLKVKHKIPAGVEGLTFFLLGPEPWTSVLSRSSTTELHSQLKELPEMLNQTWVHYGNLITF